MVSVIISRFSQAECPKDVVESRVRQSIQEREIVIEYDGSTDASNIVAGSLIRKQGSC